MEAQRKEERARDMAKPVESSPKPKEYDIYDALKDLAEEDKEKVKQKLDALKEADQSLTPRQRHPEFVAIVRHLKNFDKTVFEGDFEKVIDAGIAKYEADEAWRRNEAKKNEEKKKRPRQDEELFGLNDIEAHLSLNVDNNSI